MSDDDDVTDPRKLARQAQARLRGSLPSAEPGSVAELFGHAPPTDSHPSNGGEQTRRAMRQREEIIARREWLNRRREGIGASEVATLMGWGFQDSSPYKLYLQKVGAIPPGDDADNERYEYGRRAEPMLAAWFEDVTGLYVGCHQEFRRHPELEWAIATIDGEVYDHPVGQSIPADEPDVWTFPEPLGGLELKTTSAFAWKPDDPIPDHYQAQGQWQMFVCGWERLWFAVLHGTAFRVYQLERDERDIAMLVGRAGDFWNNHVVAQVPPDIDDSAATRDALGSAYRGDRDKTTVALPELAPVMWDLRDAKAEVKQAEARVQLYENQIKAAMGDATYATFGSEQVEVSWSRFPRKSVDTKALKDRYPDVYDAVMKATPSSMFRVADREDF